MLFKTNIFIGYNITDTILNKFTINKNLKLFERNLKYLEVVDHRRHTT